SEFFTPSLSSPAASTTRARCRHDPRLLTLAPSGQTGEAKTDQPGAEQAEGRRLGNRSTCRIDVCELVDDRTRIRRDYRDAGVTTCYDLPRIADDGSNG